MVVSKEILHQTLACSPVILSQFMVGLGWGWIAPTLVKLQEADSIITLTADQASWLASINEVGRVLGPFISPLLVDNIGRKYTLFLITIMFSSVWFSVIFTTDVYILFVARIIFGVANGIHDVVAGIYTTENCSPTFRGIIGGVVQLMFFGGLFVEFILGTYLSYVNTAIVNTLIALSVFAALYFATETPYFLIMKGRHAEAEKNLIWLQGTVDSLAVADELSKIKESVLAEKEKKKSLLVLLSSASNVKAIVTVVGIYLLGVATGGCSFVPYASLIFTSSEQFTSSQYTILFGVVQFLAVAVSPFIVEKINRRTLVIGSFIGITASNVCSYVLVYLNNNSDYEVMFYPWLIFASISVYGIFNSLMAGAIYAIKGELLPLSVRAVGSSMTVTGHALASFVVAKVFIPISENFGMETNFLLYSVISLTTTIFVYFVLPETRGKSLHEIQNSYKTERVKMDDLGVILNKKMKGKIIPYA